MQATLYGPICDPDRYYDGNRTTRDVGKNSGGEVWDCYRNQTTSCELNPSCPPGYSEDSSQTCTPCTPKSYKACHNGNVYWFDSCGTAEATPFDDCAAQGKVCQGTTCVAPAPTCTDNDGDGYGDPASASCTYSGLDCDDWSNQKFPGEPPFRPRLLNTACPASRNSVRHWAMPAAVTSYSRDMSSMSSPRSTRKTISCFILAESLRFFSFIQTPPKLLCLLIQCPIYL